MARPQIENGYARIANELLIALSQYNFSPYETRVLFFILRKTYGWNKKDDYISVSQIAEGTGLLKPHACRAKNTLVRKNILTEKGGKLGPNKDYDKWSVTNSGNVTNRGNESALISEKQRNVTDTGNGVSVTNSGNGVTGTGNKSLPAEALQKTRKTLLQKKTLYKGKKSGLPKGKKENIPPAVQQVFNHWNQYGGLSVQKRNSRGKNLLTVRWKAHRLLTKDKRQAIAAALKDYPAEQIYGAIDNFAKILLGREYFWTYPWTLHEFLTRGVERHKGAARQWWAFLSDNFDAERYRSGGGDDVLFSDPSIEEAEAIRDRIMARSKT